MALIRDVKLRRAVHLALAKAVEHGWDMTFTRWRTYLRKFYMWWSQITLESWNVIYLISGNARLTGSINGQGDPRRTGLDLTRVV